MSKKNRGHPGTVHENLWEKTLAKKFTIDNQYTKRLIELSCVMFEWKNLPEEVDPRIIEMTLFGEGRALFFHDDEAEQYLCLPFNPTALLDVNGNPTQCRAFSRYNSYQFVGNEKNSVPISNTVMRLPSYPDTVGYSQRPSELDQISDVNCKAQKTPILIQCDREQRLSLVNLYEQYDGNVPVIFGDSALNREALGAINTGAPYVSKELYDLKQQYWNEALSYLGITNSGNNKKERLNDMEFASLQGGTIANRYARLTERRKACDKINKIFKLNVECDFRQDFEIPLDLIEEMQNVADDAPEVDTVGRSDKDVHKDGED